MVFLVFRSIDPFYLRALILSSDLSRLPAPRIALRFPLFTFRFVNPQRVTAVPRRACGGLLDQRERWSLSPRGWLVLMSLLLGLGAVLFFQVQPFLAVTHRVPTDVMVVEGWLPKYAINAAVSEFKAGSYQRVYTTGGPVDGSAFDSDYQSAAQLGAARLSAAGLSKDAIQGVPCTIRDRDRTYSSAIALRNWLRDRDLDVRALNVVTVGVHARRTQLLYQMAFGDSVTVGIISVPDDDYPAARWWGYSEGVRNVIGETIAYLYARLLFSPGKGGVASLSAGTDPHSLPSHRAACATNRSGAQRTLLQVQGALAYEV